MREMKCVFVLVALVCLTLSQGARGQDKEDNSEIAELKIQMKLVLERLKTVQKENADLRNAAVQDRADLHAMIAVAKELKAKQAKVIAPLRERVSNLEAKEVVTSKTLN